MRQAYDDRLSGIIDETMWQSVSRDYQDRIHALEAQLERMAVADLNYYELGKKLLELPERLSHGWVEADEQKKGIFLGILCSNATLKDGKPFIELDSAFSFFLKIKSLENGCLIRTELENLIRLAMPQAETAERMLA